MLHNETQKIHLLPGSIGVIMEDYKPISALQTGSYAEIIEGISEHIGVEKKDLEIKVVSPANNHDYSVEITVSVNDSGEVELYDYTIYSVALYTPEPSPIMEPYQLVNQTYRNFKDFFVFDPEKGGLHNFLWEILVKQKFDDQTVALTVVVMDGNELAVASEKGGYFKTGLRFVNPDYNAATPILNDLNQIVFGLSKDEADRIIMKSMKADIDE